MTGTLTPTEMQQLVSGFGNHSKFCSHLQICNKEGIPVPYRNSPAGQKLNAAIRRQEQAGQPVRICCLKASQVWMSSSAATEIFRRVPFFPGRRALVLADTQSHADLVFEYYSQYIKSYQLNPYGSECQAAITLPQLEKDSDQHLRWSNRSSVLVGTANNVDIGRSAPYNWAHLSEAAFYRALSRLMTGLMQRVPNSADSGVIVESTANGEGGDFHDLCQLAMSGRSGWLFVFFAWFEHPENQLPVTQLGYKDRVAFERSLSRLELQERAAYNLTIEQLAWRRFTIETGCSGRIGSFRQEHPGNPQEAFQGTGRAIFDMSALSRMPTIQEPTRGRLEVMTVGLERRPVFVQDSDGRGELAIYQQPQKGKHYAAGIDHAEGIDPGAKIGASDPDYCSMTVLDVDTGEEVAKLSERYEPRPWAERVYWLARYYNWAFVTPEQKAVGKAVIGHLLEIEGGYPLELIYSAERDPSDRRPALLQELGFDTNTILRPVLVSALDTAIREHAIKLHDPQTMQQLRTFVRKPNGREEGVKHDDDVFGVALCVVGLPKARRAFAYRAERAKEHEKQWRVEKYGSRASRDDDE
jgi:hypothetical protein